MAVDIIFGTDLACFYCTTEDAAFGPVFKGPDAGCNAADFLEWLRVTEHRYAFPRVLGDGTDPRDFSDGDLRSLVALFEREREAVDA